MSHELQGVIHEPFGRRHPYLQDPTERMPRFPLAEQPVVLGAGTWPKEEAESIFALFWIGTGSQSNVAAGRKVGEGSDHTYWEIRLPDFPKGVQVSYQIHAKQGERIVSTRTFRFETSYWNRTVGMAKPAESPREMSLKCQVDGPPYEYTFSLQEVAPKTLRIRLAWPRDTTGRRGVGPLHAVHASQQFASRLGSVEAIISGKSLRTELREPTGEVVVCLERGPLWLTSPGHGVRKVRLEFSARPTEAFYGLGERFNGLDQRGNMLDTRVFDPYKQHNGRTYLPVPFLLSSQGYGIYVATTRNIIFDLAHEEPNRWWMECDVSGTNSLECYLIVSDDPKEVIAGYVAICGRPSLPPKWVFGPWMSSNNWDNQQVVDEQLRLRQIHRIPFTVLVLEAWSDEATFYIWNDASYSPLPGSKSFSYKDFTFSHGGKWPDPRALIEKAHEQGIRVLLWQIPVMPKLDRFHHQHAEDEKYMLARGFAVAKEDGTPYLIRPPWFEGGLLLDVTNPEAVNWWLEKRRYLLEELGVDGFKTDGGEHIWGDDLRFSDGRGANDLSNLYPNLYIGAYHEFARACRGGDAVTFSRSGFAGVQRFPCHWSGDDDSTWAAFRRAILAGLSAAMSGIPFWGWDLAGFSGETPDAELYLRAVAMAAFCPIMQFHSEHAEGLGTHRDRSPWNIQERTSDQDIIPTFRKFANLRMNLLPYIYAQSRYSSQSGVPLMRSLVIEYPSDGMCRGYPYQYLFGDSFLVAPVVEPGVRSQKVYLPTGRWVDFWSGKQYNGGSQIDYPTPKQLIPVFVRAGSLIPMDLGDELSIGSDVGNNLDSYRNLCLGVYPGGLKSFRWEDDVSHGVWQLKADGEINQDRLLVKISGPPLPIVIRLPAACKSVTSGNLSLTRAQTLYDFQNARGDAWLGNRETTLVRLLGEHRNQQLVLHLDGKEIML